MKIFNILFLAIKESEFDFLVQRHNTDVKLYQEFNKDWEIQHLKLYERGYTPEKQTADQVFFSGGNSFFHFPLKMCLYIRQHKPDIIIAHGFKFAFQLFALQFFLPKKTKIIVQHHAESPYKNPIKFWLQKRAFSKAAAFLFSSRIMANEFIEHKIIPGPDLVYELPESSTIFQVRDKGNARNSLQLPANKLLFLWVGRLNANKDPLTVLKAFKRFSKDNPLAELFMFFHEDDLLLEIEHYIGENELAGFVSLKGYHPQNELENWYNACDYFISGSHYESTGYALCEALACGCVPIATAIPSFQKLTNNGACSVLFEPGNATDLYEKLSLLDTLDYVTKRQEAIAHFNRELSFAGISKKFVKIVTEVNGKTGD